MEYSALREKERRMCKKLVLVSAVFALVSGAVHADETIPTIYRKDGKNLSCSLTLSGDKKEYYVSSSSLTAMKTMKIVHCLGKATRKQPLLVKDDEVLVRTRIFANIGGLRCYKGKRFILKFKGDIPGNLEKLIDACFLKAAYEFKERMDSKNWT